MSNEHTMTEPEKEKKENLLVMFSSNYGANQQFKWYLAPGLNDESKHNVGSRALRIYACCSNFSTWKPLASYMQIFTMSNTQGNPQLLV